MAIIQTNPIQTTKIYKKGMIIIRKIPLILTILWMALIFYFSNQPADISSHQSGTILVKLKLITQEELKEVDNAKINILQRVIRKTAHFTVYLILGILLSLSLRKNGKNRQVYLLLWIIGTLYAMSDEIHQYFIPGRSTRLLDITIDSAGVLTGLLIYYGIRHLQKNN